MVDAAPAAHASAAPRSLEGLTILDLTRVLAGPSATQLMGDLGARVIKVERPGTGDDTRAWGPPFVPGADGAPSDLSAYFLAANRNKRSIAIDLASEAGAGLVRDLAARADVVIENYKPGDLARRGLGYEDLRAVKPDLVWCSITGFGHDGPYAERIGYDFLVQAMGGIMSITGEPDGEPMKVGVGISDLMCGMYAVVGILAALRHRDATGEGQFLDVSLYDTQISWLVNAATNTLVSGRAPRRLGNRHPNIAPYQTYRAADGHLVVAVGNDAQFRRFCAALGAPELARDSRFATNAGRLAHLDALNALLDPIVAGDTVAGWGARLEAAQVPAGPVASVPEALADPHTRARGMVIEMPSPVVDGETLSLLGNPLKLRATPVAYDRAPPPLGADRDAVLAEVLGLDAEAIAALARAGAFGRVP
ncbi:CaiB/BaiF CoA transferase family protein [Salinarimonas chemoclinalis]|uniref:CaiB/BaiF CoA transferase family protein n=1 Tax=Salinarimonas chemoclinalis TaxID=3241599 RepID=UPI003558662F